MAHSIEVRVPYLDHDLVEWVLALPGEMKAGGGKALLVEATRDVLPPQIAARRKQGFALPLARWMAEELRAEVESTLRRPPEALAAVLDPGAMASIWDEFAHDGRRWHRPWALYALCSWVETVASSRIAAHGGTKALAIAPLAIAPVGDARAEEKAA
jgi:asparagine synthase (glutamine-hydrolysing)